MKKGSKDSGKQRSSLMSVLMFMGKHLVVGLFIWWRKFTASYLFTCIYVTFMYNTFVSFPNPGELKRSR